MLKRPSKFHKIKNGMSFSRFCGYSSDAVAKNARDKMAKCLKEEGKAFKLSKTSAYAGGAMLPAYLITDVRSKVRK